jgi:hypothetical protein
LTRQDLDELVAGTFVAAIDVQPQRHTKAGRPTAWPDERRWGREICNQLAIAGVSADPDRDAEQLTPSSGDWDPPPGKVDVHPRDIDGSAGSLFLAELKLDNVNESLWDAFKLAWVATTLRTGAQYLACAASDRRWSDPSGGGELFPVVGSRVAQSFDLIRDCHKKWCGQWRRDHATPHRVPSSLETVAVLSGHRPRSYPQLELRIVRVAAHTSTMLELTDGVPVGLPNCGAPSQLEGRTRGDLL